MKTGKRQRTRGRRCERLKARASSEQTEPLVSARDLARGERREVGRDDCREVAPHRAATEFASLAEREPEERALGGGRERLGDEEVEGARSSVEERRHDERDYGVGAGRQPESGEVSLPECVPRREAEDENRRLDGDREEIAERKEEPEVCGAHRSVVCCYRAATFRSFARGTALRPARAPSPA